MKHPQLTLRRILIAAALIGVGVPTIIQGCRLEWTHAKSSEEDSAAWLIIQAGTFLVGAGVAFLFTRPVVAAAIGFMVSPLVFVSVFVAYWGTMLVGGLLHALSQ